MKKILLSTSIAVSTALILNACGGHSNTQTIPQISYTTLSEMMDTNTTYSATELQKVFEKTTWYDADNGTFDKPLCYELTFKNSSYTSLLEGKEHATGSIDYAQNQVTIDGDEVYDVYVGKEYILLYSSNKIVILWENEAVAYKYKLIAQKDIIPLNVNGAAKDYWNAKSFSSNMIVGQSTYTPMDENDDGNIDENEWFRATYNNTTITYEQKGKFKEEGADYTIKDGVIKATDTGDGIEYDTILNYATPVSWDITFREEEDGDEKTFSLLELKFEDRMLKDKVFNGTTFKDNYKIEQDGTLVYDDKKYKLFDLKSDGSFWAWDMDGHIAKFFQAE